MNNQEAIKIITEFGLYHAIGDLPNSALTVKAFDMAIAALEKADSGKCLLAGENEIPGNME